MFFGGNDSVFNVPECVGAAIENYCESYHLPSVLERIKPQSSVTTIIYVKVRTIQDKGHFFITKSQINLTNFQTL